MLQSYWHCQFPLQSPQNASVLWYISESIVPDTIPEGFFSESDIMYQIQLAGFSKTVSDVDCSYEKQSTSDFLFGFIISPEIRETRIRH